MNKFKIIKFKILSSLLGGLQIFLNLISFLEVNAERTFTERVFFNLRPLTQLLKYFRNRCPIRRTISPLKLGQPCAPSRPLTQPCAPSPSLNHMPPSLNHVPPAPFTRPCSHPLINHVPPPPPSQTTLSPLC
jgi:hypothetical protein